MSDTIQTTRVAIIGGGIMGVAAQFQLAENGWTDTILFEKAELTSGSTWHAAGQIAHAVGSRLMGWINKTSIETYKRVEAETGQSIGWHEVGGIRIATTDDEVDWMKSIMGVGKLLDLPMDLIGPEEVAQVNPFYKVDDVRAAVRTYEDGHIDPSSVTMALAAASRSRGARVERHNRVLGASRKGDMWLSRTEKGDVLAEHVVIAAGSYANQVGEWFGLKIPSVSCLHHYLVTDTVPQFADRPELPVMRDNAYGGYIRQEQKSGLIGIYEGHVCPTVWEMPEGAPWAAENELFQADYDSIGDFLMVAFDKMPILAELGIKRVVRGAITHTPDGGMLVGPSGAPNVWLSCGSSIGLAWGGGAGKVLADWMVHGEAEINTRGFDPRRYGDFASDNFIVERTKDEFMRRHDTPCPGKQFQSLRPLKKHPLYDRLAAKGAVFGEVAGWERPRYFGEAGEAEQIGWGHQPWHANATAEAKATRDAAGVIDLCAFAQFEISGKDAGALLDRLSANRIPSKDGRMSLNHLLTAQGRFETEITIWRMAEDRFFTGSPIARATPDFDWIKSHIRPGEDVTMINRSADWGMLALSGPATRRILSELTDVDLSNRAFPWLSGQEIRVAGILCYALRVSFVGELGWELHAPLDQIGAIYDALFEAGSKHGLTDLGSYAFNGMRMEKAYRASGELTTDVGPLDVGLERFVVSEGRDFLGRDALLSRDPAWQLFYAELHSENIDIHGGEPVLLKGEPVGLTSSGGYGYTIGKSLGWLFVRKGTLQTGLSVRILNRDIPVTVHQDALFDPQNLRPRSEE
ncbi:MULTISPECIES: FAD-dependent oxidoreductase [unclassified Ruegeria]|uniref:GcvT family protein n=1 Tax=unclassified Ruegeria TaxID=2625375 RepID=UPI001490F66F|nr:MULTISPECIES: FAD-dependent oxidoreductase [unclassified Ruegeria]NOD47601.1 FAD-dependent oxidoreductase [Ruegeria sp. HKCCD5849]NOD52736.1 FAD-dependent oxidoreductase [Ruegeria sp. HKCCD5851]NOD66155.1 FAD-dependent oxidoreductase [Ruegeria sp. HKCCD7303]